MQGLRKGMWFYSSKYVLQMPRADPPWCLYSPYVHWHRTWTLLCGSSACKTWPVSETGNDSSKHTAPLAGSAAAFDDQGHATVLLSQVSIRPGSCKKPTRQRSNSAVLWSPGLWLAAQPSGETAGLQVELA